MPKLTALHPINHDGKDYAEGDTLEVLDARQASQLIDAGAAEESVSTRAPRKPRVTTQAEQDADAADKAAAEKAVADKAAADLADGAGADGPAA